jgi:hypothetical protein
VGAIVLEIGSFLGFGSVFLADTRKILRTVLFMDRD